MSAATMAASLRCSRADIDPPSDAWIVELVPGVGNGWASSPPAAHGQEADDLMTDNRRIFRWKCPPVRAVVHTENSIHWREGQDRVG